MGSSQRTRELPFLQYIQLKVEMFCFGSPKKQFHAEIFCTGDNSAAFQRKENANSSQKWNISSLQGLEARDEHNVQEDLMARLSPIDTMTLTADELPLVLFDLQKWVHAEEKTEQHMVRMIKKSNYQQLIRQFKGKCGQWVDPDFPRKEYYDLGEPKVKLSWEGLDVVSKRVGKQVRLVDKFIQYKDIVQGDVGDCYFVSAVAAVARQPQRILRLFPTLSVDNRIFMVRLMFKGILQEVVVDQYFPYVASTQQLLACRPCKSQSEIYVMVLQKCWAKLWKSYAQIDTGFPQEALRALTGAPTKNYFMNQEAKDEKTTDSFFKKALGYFESQFVMCTGTKCKGIVEISHRERGRINIQVEARHIYTVEQVLVENGENLIKIYNPWGHNLISGTGIRVNGQFRIKWSEYVKHFTYLTVCKVKDNANYLYLELEGCKRDNLRFIDLEVFSRAPTSYVLGLSQTDRKEKQSHRYVCVTFVVLREYEDKSVSLVSMKTSYKFSDHYLELDSLPNGKYVVGMYFSEVDIKENLTFFVYSEGKFGFKQAKKSQVYQEHFFSNVLQGYNAMNRPPARYPNCNNNKVWISFQTLVADTTFGYYLIHVDKDSPSSFAAKMSRSQFEQIGLALLPPYNKDTFEVKADPGHETILVLLAKDFQQFQILDATYFFNNKRHIHENLVFGQSFCNAK